MSRTVAASAIQGPSPGWQAGSGRDLTRSVRSAGRHSRFVRVLRVGLPAAIVLGLGGYVANSYFNPMAALSAMPSVSGKLAVQGNKITMEAPRIAGISREQRSYQITAEQAVQDIANPDQIELQNLRAEMEMPDAEMVVITARSGSYFTKGDRVILRDHVVVSSTTGMNAKLQEATVDVKKGNVQSDQPVEVKMPSGVILANGLEIADSGDVIRFTRGVVMNLEAEAPGPKK